MTTITRSLFLLLLIFTLTNHQAISQSFSADQKQSLRGLNAVLVVVDFAQDAAVTSAINREQLETDIRRKVAASGIRLMNEMEWSRAEGMPYLYIYLNALGSELGFYSYRVEVKVQQEVILKRNRGLSQLSTTWETGTLGTVGVNQIPGLKAEIFDLVDIFLEDHKLVN